MKVLGYVFIGFAVLNFLVAIVAAGGGDGQMAGQKIGGVLMMGVLGAFCLSRAKKKDEEEKEREKWRKGE